MHPVVNLALATGFNLGVVLEQGVTVQAGSQHSRKNGCGLAQPNDRRGLGEARAF
ncbi:MAG TPA: hypothetical protein VFM48_10395 [Aquabacterium sp.]|nr:hypothetical protein [Aquabacterium sp.]